jgi:hypothetical protein
LEKTLPRKKNDFGKSHFFVQPLLPKNSLNASPVSRFRGASPFFSLCQVWQQDPVTNNDTLTKNLDAEYLILCQTVLSQPLGHPDGGRDEVVFKFQAEQ